MAGDAAAKGTMMDPRERATLFQEVQSHVSRGEYDPARQKCARILAASPDDPDGLRWSAIVTANLGLNSDAEATLRRLITVRPQEIDGRFILARVLTMQQRTDDALAMYDEIVKLRPDAVHAYVGKADLLVLAGRSDEARRLLEQQRAAGRDAPEIALVLASIEEQSGDFEKAVATAKPFAESAGAAPATRRQLFYLIGRCFDKLKRYDEAFAALARGNQFAEIVFDAREFEQFIDRVIAVFSRKNFKSMPKSSLDSELPIFVTSMPRTGSTLVERIINAHSQMRGVGELNLIGGVAQSAPERLKTQRPYPDCIEGVTRKGLDLIGRAYLDQVEPLAGGVERIVDKTLQTWQHIGLLQLILPESRVINVRRHPMDTCLSCYMAALSPQVHPYSFNLNDLAFYYRQYDRLMKHWLDVARIELLEVQYEALVDEPERVSREIIEFCGMDWEDDCLQYHKKSEDLVLTLSHDQVRKPVYKSAVARWRRYERHLAPLRAALGDLAQID